MSTWKCKNGSRWIFHLGTGHNLQSLFGPAVPTKLDMNLGRYLPISELWWNMGPCFMGPAEKQNISVMPKPSFSGHGLFRAAQHACDPGGWDTDPTDRCSKKYWCFCFWVFFRSKIGDSWSLAFKILYNHSDPTGKGLWGKNKTTSTNKRIYFKTCRFWCHFPHHPSLGIYWLSRMALFLPNVLLQNRQGQQQRLVVVCFDSSFWSR